MSGKAGELVYMLATVSESDLEQVDAEIEQELENIAKLRSVRKVIADLLGVKATRKSKKTPAGDKAPQGVRDDGDDASTVDASEDKINAACHVAAKLLHRNPMVFADIRRQAKLHPGILGKALKTDWFTKLADGRFALSDTGLEYADL